MTHIFKPGNKAYWVGVGWVELFDNHDKEYPLISNRFSATFTTHGQRSSSKDIILLPLNPYDPTDPNNPPEFKSDWPFMLRGRRLEVGMEMRGIFDDATLPVKITALTLLESDYCITCYWDGQVGNIHPNNLRFPDEVVTKKKVAKWAYPTIGVSGRLTVYFTEEITEEEARKVCGSSVEMIPGTEREVEG